MLLKTCFKKEVKTLYEMAMAKRGKNLNCFLDITVWDDGDYTVKLASSWGDYRHEWAYRHSNSKYYYQKIKILAGNEYGKEVKPLKK